MEVEWAVATRADHRAWLSYNVKFSVSKILLADENDSYTDASKQEQLTLLSFSRQRKGKVVLVLSSEDARRFKF
jgi:hypothetical protein